MKRRPNEVTTYHFELLVWICINLPHVPFNKIAKVIKRRNTNTLVYPEGPIRDWCSKRLSQLKQRKLHPPTLSDKSFTPTKTFVHSHPILSTSPPSSPTNNMSSTPTKQSKKSPARKTAFNMDGMAASLPKTKATPAVVDEEYDVMQDVINGMDFTANPTQAEYFKCPDRSGSKELQAFRIIHKLSDHQVNDKTMKTIAASLNPKDGYVDMLVSSNHDQFAKDTDDCNYLGDFTFGENETMIKGHDGKFKPISVSVKKFRTTRITDKRKNGWKNLEWNDIIRFTLPELPEKQKYSNEFNETVLGDTVLPLEDKHQLKVVTHVDSHEKTIMDEERTFTSGYAILQMAVTNTAEDITDKEDENEEVAKTSAYKKMQEKLKQKKEAEAAAAAADEENNDGMFDEE